MQVGWQVFRASSMNCSYTTSTTTVDCSGGVASNAEFTGGIKLSSIFISLQALSAFSSGTHAGNLTLNLGNLAATVNTAGTGHGIEVDGTVSRSRVTGSLTVNNQTNSSTLRDVQVRGADKAALYVKSAASVTVTNAASLVLVSGGNTRRGIRAEASSGTASVTNSGAIGFSCTSNCGTGHSAIYSRVASGTGANTVTNSGTLNMKTTAGTSSRGVIFDGGTPTFINTGNITADTHAVLLTSGVNGAATINFNGGTVTVDSMLVFSSSPNQSVTVNVGGGTATGRFSLTNEDDTVNVNNGGTLVLANGASVFGGGTDTLTVNSGGALHLGDATNGSDGVTMTGLDTFTINAGATLRFYENDGSSLNEFGTNTAFTLGNAIIELYLPAGFSLADRAASTIIDVGTGTLTVSDATLTALASNLRIIRGGERYAATVTFTKSNNGKELQLAWTNLGVAPSSLSCSLSATTLSCLGGNATDYEFVNGMAMAAFFAKATGITGGSVSGNLTLSVNNLAATVNTSGTDHGFIADGTAASSDVGGTLTVNLQGSSQTIRDIQVRASDKASVFVKHDKDVTMRNAGQLVFSKTGSSFNNSLIGAQVRGTQDVTITNTGRIGFAATDTTRQASRGSNHVGILGHFGGAEFASGASAHNLSITNSGDIIIMDGGTGKRTSRKATIANARSAAFVIQFGRENTPITLNGIRSITAGTATINNSGLVQTTGDLISVRYEASFAITRATSRTATEEINLFVDLSRARGGNAVCSGTDANAVNLFQITGGQGDGRVLRIPVGGRLRIVGASVNSDTNCGLRTRDPKLNLFHTGAGEAKRMEGYYTGSNDTDTITIGYSGTGNTYVTNAVFRTLGMDMGTFGSVAGEVRLGNANSESADRTNVDTADKVVNYGEFHIGGGTSGMVSSDVTIVGLETFEARANSTIAIYLKASGSGYTGGAVMAGTNVVLYQNASNQRAGVAIVLPANSAFSVGDAFTVDILTARSISGSDGANTLTSSQLQAYLEAVSIDFYRQNADGSRSSLSLGGDAGLFGSLTTRSNGSILTVSWRAEAPMRCSGTTAIRCTGGFGSELQNGVTLSAIFSRAGVSSITGSGSVTLSGFSTDVNTSSTSDNHGIEIDGTNSNSSSGWSISLLIIKPAPPQHARCL